MIAAKKKLEAFINNFFIIKEFIITEKFFFEKKIKIFFPYSVNGIFSKKKNAEEEREFLRETSTKIGINEKRFEDLLENYDELQRRIFSLETFILKIGEKIVHNF